MKVVINKCYGGFSLSPAGVRRLAELNGRGCYFFTNRRPHGSLDFKQHYPVKEEAIDGMFWTAFDIPNPDEVIGEARLGADGTYKTFNELYERHELSSRPQDRSDPKLIQVVEELGGKHRNGASGLCAQLKVIKIPDGVEYEISEYDGVESIHEVHRSWS